VTDGPECLLAEKPCLGALAALRYEYLPPEHAEAAREGLNNVLLRPVLVEAVQRLNGMSEEVARAVYAELLGRTDNEE
jgi:type I restriction enzyme, R subunit